MGAEIFRSMRSSQDLISTFHLNNIYISLGQDGHLKIREIVTKKRTPVQQLLRLKNYLFT